MSTFFCARRAGALIVLLLLACTVSRAAEQPAPAVRGDFLGRLGPLGLSLHIEAQADGTLRGTLDSPNQGAYAIPIADVRNEGQSLSFSVPSVNGTWKGSIQENGERLVGEWSQGAPQPLVFVRDTFEPAERPSRVDGIWLGSLDLQGRSVRIQLVVKSDKAGRQFCSVDSLDQNGFGRECANVQYVDEGLSFDVPSAGASWRGKLSADGATLAGTSWPTSDPSRASALNFTRQAQRIGPSAPPPPSYDAAIEPVSAAEMEAVLRRDLAKTMSTGLLAPGKPTGIAVGVVRNGVRRVFTLGSAKPDSLFEIGSITKTFTGLLLAQMIEQGRLQADAPVRELLPAGVVAKPPGAEITLLDLVTQRSGLPRMPGNFRPADSANPYADYHEKQLYEFISTHGVAKPDTAQFLYSNLGFGLLGQALANRAGSTYPELLKRAVLDPLGMNDTAIALSPEQQRRFIAGHNPGLQPVSPWDLVAFAGAGGVRSTAEEMLKYLEANLHPQVVAASGSSEGEARTLATALVRSHAIQADAGQGLQIGYAWLRGSDGDYWHNGGTGGFSTYAFFNPSGDYAAVVLVNVSPGPRGGFADQLARHISQRFAGKPAFSLD